MNRGRALGVNRRAHISYMRDNTELRKIKTEDLNNHAKSIIDRIEEIFTTAEVSNTTLYDILRFIHIPKPKGEDKNQQMRMIVISYIYSIFDEIDNMVKRYPNIRRKISLRIEILNKIDLLSMISNTLTKEKFVNI